MQKEKQFELPIDITENDIHRIANLYNVIIANPISTLKYRLRYKPSKGENYIPLWWADAVSTIRLISSLGAEEATFLLAQGSEYRPVIARARPVPSLRMCHSPAAIKRYQNYMERCHPEEYKKTPNLKNMIIFCSEKLIAAMKRDGIISERAWWQSPVNVTAFPREFLLNRPTFVELFNSGFYIKNFNLTEKELLP